MSDARRAVATALMKQEQGGYANPLGALYPAKTVMEKECSNIKSALINSNEFVHSTPKDFGENSIICLSCHKGNTPETMHYNEDGTMQYVEQTKGN